MNLDLVSGNRARSARAVAAAVIVAATALGSAPAVGAPAPATSSTPPPSDDAFTSVFAKAFAAPPRPDAATLPAGFNELNVATLSSPNSFVFTPDGRILINQQGGQLRVVDASGALLPTPFATFTVSSSGERGLLGLELDPNFATNQFVYVYYTATTPAFHNRVSRITANGNVMLAGSEVQLLNIDNLGATNHNGGAIHFGADGYLYIATGENAVSSNAQDITSNLLGKVLRIDVNGDDFPADPLRNYAIPPSNPFAGATVGDDEIWAYGLRNPWRFTVQPVTGLLFIADVGNGTREEVDIGVSGGNFGWPGREGTLCTGVGTCGGILPLFEYDHAGTGAAITGGDFYSGTNFGAGFTGAYFYGDSVDSFMRFLRLDGSNAVLNDNAFATAGTASAPVEIRYYANAIWYSAIGASQLRRVSFGLGNDGFESGNTLGWPYRSPP